MSSTESGSSGVPGEVVAGDVLREGEGNVLGESGKLVSEERVVDCNVAPWASESRLQDAVRDMSRDTHEPKRKVATSGEYDVHVSRMLMFGFGICCLFH